MVQYSDAYYPFLSIKNSLWITQHNYSVINIGFYPCQYHYTQVLSISLSNAYYRVLPIYCGTSFKQLIAALKKASPTKRVELVVSRLCLNTLRQGTISNSYSTREEIEIETTQDVINRWYCNETICNTSLHGQRAQ